jgi:hypothetical protein
VEGPAVNKVGARPGRGTRLLLLAGALALAAICTVTARAGAQAGGGTAGCGDGSNGTCVMMIQIDGLEAADVTQATTPFLWELAHPTDGDPINEGRNGWIWQAPRASMSAGLGANAASFLYGGYAEQTGVPADDFHRGDEDQGTRVRLGGSDVPGNPENIDPADSELVPGKSVLHLVNEAYGDDTTAAFIGDPNLGPLIAGLDNSDVDFGWYPTPGDQGNPPNPAYCDVPRAPGAGPPPTTPACAANDAATLARAFQDLGGGDARNVTLTYIELAELGHVKRSGGDVPAALTSTDLALEAFLTGYSQQQSTSDQWDRTILMVSGTSGYEPSLPQNRVPDPDAPNPPNPSDPENGQDLAHEVGQFSQDKFELIPQGTMATVHPDQGPNTFNDTAANPSPEHRNQLALLKARIESVNNHPLCQADNQPPAGPDLCIEEVLYARPELTPDGSANGTVKEAHPDWHLDHLKFSFDPQTGDSTSTPTGRSGDLVVVMKPGWAAGKAVPADQSEAIAGDSEIITNPYLASAGGPRNRAVAALINGPEGQGGVTQVLDTQSNQPNGGRYAVVGSAQGPADNPDCDIPGVPVTSDVAAANGTPEDDANAEGHECQAETLDFAPTTAALLKVPLPADQICGRILNEAFASPIVPTVDTEGAPDAFITQGPVTAPAGQQYPQTDRDVTFEFDTSVRNRAVYDCGESRTVATTFECSFDGAPYSPCASPFKLSGLAKGIHDFCVRAISEGLPPSEPECAKFEVILFFDFDGVLRDLRAKVADSEGKSWAEVARGTRMDRIVISADYGRPLSAVTLTLYKQSSGRVLCGVDVYKPKASTSSARASASCPLTGIARFKPFKLDRGHIDLRLRIPKAYKPTHVGVTVQEVVANVLDATTARQCQTSGNFFCFYSKVGVPDGGIVRLGDARTLHKVKGQKTCKKGKKKGKRAAKGCKKKKKR